MVSTQLIRPGGQLCGVASLTELIRHKDDLAGQLQSFLLTCKVLGLSPETLQDYHGKMQIFLRFCRTLGVTQVGEVDRNVFRLFLLKLEETNNPTSVRDYYRVVRRFFNWLVDEEVLEASPVARVKPPRPETKVIQPFHPDQIRDMLLLCDDNTFLGARDKAIVLMLLDTGLRRSELVSIQIKDVDLDRELIKVRGKGAKERVVRIGRRTQKALIKYLLMRSDDLPCLWVTKQGGPLRVTGLDEAVRTLGRRAGIEGVRCSPHTFRHTFATSWLRNGGSEFALQSALGHSSLDMTRRYSSTVRSEDAAVEHRRVSPADNLKLS